MRPLITNQDLTPTVAYGSRAGGKPMPGSDLDIMVVREGAPRTAAEIAATEKAISAATGVKAHVNEVSTAEYAKLWEGHVTEVEVK